MKKGNHGEEGRDRLSQLPDVILHRIMNFIQIDFSNSFRSVACFNMLSKSCQQAFLSYGHLFFIQGRLENETHFVDRVDRTLQQSLARGTPIDGFTVEAKLSEQKKDPILRWLNWIRALNVRVINLRFVNYVEIPLLLFSDMTSLEEIYFERCKLLMPCFKPDSCQALRKLSLNNGYKDFNNNILEDILSELTQLECLSLSCLCWCKEGLRISSPSIKNLKIVRYDTIRELRIKCPNLRHLSYDGYVVPLIYGRGSRSLSYELDLCFFNGFMDNTRKDTFFKQLKCLIWDFNHKVSCLEIWFTSAWAMCDKGSYRKRVSVVEPDRCGRPAKLKYLKLNLVDACCPFPSEIIDQLLLLVKPKFLTVTFHYQNGYFNKVLQFIVNMGTDKRNMFKCGCGNGRQLEHCWHHTLGEVKLEWSGLIRNNEEIDLMSLDLDFLSRQINPPRDVSLRVSFRLMWQ